MFLQLHMLQPAYMRLPPSAQVQDSQSQSAEAVQLGCQGQKGHPFHQLKFILWKHLGGFLGAISWILMSSWGPFGVLFVILWWLFANVALCKAIQPFEITSLKCDHLVSTWIPATNARVNNQTAHAAEILHFKQWPFPDRSLRVGVMMCGWYLCCLPQLLRTYEPYSSNGDTLQHSISIWHPSRWDSRSSCTSWIAFLVESENICLIMLSCCWK